MIGTRPFAMYLPVAAALLLAAGCSGDSPGQAAAPTSTAAVPTLAVTTEVAASSPDEDLAALPVREGPREETTHGVPHIQTSAELVPEVDAELERRAFSIPGVENRQSEVSLPGARGLWIADDIELARPDVLLSGREFAHIHPNGSLHVWMPVELALEVTEKKWGEFHPWVGRDDFWDGLVMVYTPENLDELDVTVQLLVEAYNFVTGADIDPATIE